MSERTEKWEKLKMKKKDNKDRESWWKNPHEKILFSLSDNETKTVSLI
jgi:hypothetical protein